MSRKGGSRPVDLEYSTSHQLDPPQSLTSRCREHLRAFHFKIHKIDVLAATEIQNLSTLPLKLENEDNLGKALFAEDDYAALEAALIQVMRNDRDWDTRNWSFREILSELSRSQSEMLRRWQNVATALHRIQNQLVRVKQDNFVFDYVEFCRALAERFLDLANDATLLLCVVAEELLGYDYRIILDLRERLSNLRKFNSIWEKLTDTEKRLQSVRDMSRGHHVFNQNLSKLTLQLDQANAPGLRYNDALHKWDPTLIAVTMLVLVLCVVMLALAWQHSLASRGSPQDSGFFFLIQGAMMQALGIFTVMLPLRRRTAYQAWKWAWFFAIIGTISLLSSVVLYCLVQTWWSGLCAFVAAASQAAITLQVMLMVDSTWKEATEKRKNL